MVDGMEDPLTQEDFVVVVLAVAVVAVVVVVVVVGGLEPSVVVVVVVVVPSGVVGVRVLDLCPPSHLPSFDVPEDSSHEPTKGGVGWGNINIGGEGGGG